MILKLDRIAGKYSEEKGFEKVITSYKIREIIKFIKGPDVLDLGCGEGIITRAIASLNFHVVAVDGSKLKLQKAKKNISNNNVKFIHSFFENFDPPVKFNSIVMSNILEHVNKPDKLLTRAKSWLKHDGRIIATVPNADSLNRLLGLKMGVISGKKELTAEDKHKGHRRVYDMKSLKTDFKSAGFKVKFMGGIFLKPLPHKYMEKIDDENIYEGLYKLRLEYPNLCSSLIAVALK